MLTQIVTCLHAFLHVYRHICLYMLTFTNACRHTYRHTCVHMHTQQTTTDFLCFTSISLFSSLCLNGGTCDDGVDTYSCRCPSGYSGAHCERLLTACDSNPCLNDGLCRTSGQTYTCICASGWKGHNCNELVDWCNGTAPVCQNGGTCSQNANQFQCTCKPGWTGQKCDMTNVTCAVEAANRGRPL